MTNIRFLCFLLLLVAPLTIADKDFPDRFEIIEDFEVEEGDEEYFELLAFPFWEYERGNKVLVNVDGFGAVGDGVSDDTQAFVNAWEQACSTPQSVLLVPEGRRYLVNATRFRGPCADKLVIQIEGTIVAPDDPKKWDPKNSRIWLSSYNISKVLFQGKGIIDRYGTKWWAASCKKNKSNPCISAPTSAYDVKVSALEDSPNTDGIHITESTNVILQNCKIGTGDDCISIVNASSGIKMKNIYCGPGHGISIGSLGKDNSTGIVEKVVLDNAFLRGTTNGLRIKTYQGGFGHVRSVRYQDVRMDNVSNPIIIDQFYCDSPIACQNQTSAVEISQVMYRNVTGTSRSQKAMNFACNDTVPCTHIVLNHINLHSRDGNSVAGFGVGYINPSAGCLSSSDKDLLNIQKKKLISQIQERISSILNYEPNFLR